MTTLADMTPEQRQQCVGMWCDIETPMGTETVIYDQSRWTKGPTLFEPGFGHFDVDLSDITPRPDLPRAWRVDGTPTKGMWEYDTLPADDAANPTSKEIVDRHWISEWEAMPYD